MCGAALPAAGNTGFQPRIRAERIVASSEARPVRNELLLKYGRFDPLGAREPAVPAELAASPNSQLRIVQFIAPPTEAMRQAVRDRGAAIVATLVHNGVVVRGESGSIEALTSSPQVRWVGAYHPAYRIETGLLEQAGVKGKPAAIAVNIQVFERGPVMKGAVAERIRTMGGKVDAFIPDGFRLQATLTREQIVAAARMDEVQWIDAGGGQQGADNNLCRIASGAAFIESTLGFSGEGVRGELVDDNVRDTHVDLAPLNIMFHGPRSGGSGHGTSMFGLVFGRGIGNPTARGLLPGAEQAILLDKEEITNRYAQTLELVDPQGPYRAVFQANAWGVTFSNNYTSDSAEMDDILFNADLVATQSMGNNGNQAVRPQAWAKNIIACGAVIHENTLDRSDDSWGGLGSTGPASDGRIKPDLSHFGDQIFTCGSNGDTDYIGNFGGTSGGTGITAAVSGLLAQMWHEQVFAGFGGGASVFADRPHMTTVKAMLVNSAYRYDFLLANPQLTRMRQGWGTPDLQSLYQMRTGMFIVDESVRLAMGQKARYRYQSNGAAPLRVTMVFADPAGNPASSVARINDLSLKVTSPSNVVYWGNNGLAGANWSAGGGVGNTVDTVENVFIESPEAGEWIVEVYADEVNQDAVIESVGDDVDFALVISGGQIVVCPADRDGNGLIEPADLAAFVNDWLASVTASDLVGDFDNSGFTEPADIAAFVNAWLAALSGVC